MNILDRSGVFFNTGGFMKTKRVDVKILKGMETTIAKIIWEHEFKLLEAIYGAGNVERYKKYEHSTPEGKKYKVVNDTPVTYPIVNLDYDEEYGRLQTVYGMHPKVNLPTVEYVYGSYESRGMEKEFNDLNSDAGNYIPKKTVVNIEALEKNLEDEDADGDMDYQKMTIRELKLFLDEHGISYPAKGNKTVLINAAEAFDQGVEV
jgi:hypothetical protein